MGQTVIFQGNSALTLDAKGRMTVPTRYRDALLTEEQGALTLTRKPGGGLWLYPQSVWEANLPRLLALPMEKDRIRRFLLGYAETVRMDRSGRVLITPELRQVSGLHKDVVLLGMGSYFELWGAEQFAAEAQALDELHCQDLGDLVLS